MGPAWEDRIYAGSLHIFEVAGLYGEGEGKKWRCVVEAGSPLCDKKTTTDDF